MSKAIAGRPVDDITINGEDDSSEVNVFDSPEQARAFLISHGVDKEELRHMTIMESYGTCRRCGSPLFRSFLDGYSYQCFTCDEDFYKFEQGA